MFFKALVAEGISLLQAITKSLLCKSSSLIRCLTHRDTFLKAIGLLSRTTQFFYRKYETNMLLNYKTEVDFLSFKNI